MRVTGLLSFYDEDPGWLAECVASASKLCDHLIAVDGPYGHFPGALSKPASGADQIAAITHTAAGLGMGVSVHQPRMPWFGEWGGEVAKRDFMFKLGMTFAEPGDWFFRVDADEFLTEVPDDTKHRLAESKHDVAEVILWERESSYDIDMGGDSQHPLRCLFRAIPGIRIEQAHFIVTAPINGQRTFLSGPHGVSAEPLWDVRLEHRTRMRTPGRKRLKDQYNPMINILERVEDGPRPENF